MTTTNDFTGANPSRDELSGGGIPRRQALMGLGALLFTAAGARTAAAQTAATTTPKELAGKVAIVTGARNNLGRAFAIALARSGADIVVHYHRAETQAEAEETANLVRAQGVGAVLVQGDLSIVANIRRMYDVAMNEFGRVDIVVNNAGYIKKKPFVEITEEEFDRCAGINTKGLYFSMQEAAKRIADNGRIINIGTSLLGATTGMYSAYAGTKAPVEAFTRALAKEIGNRGITGSGRRRYAILPQPGDAADGGVHQEGAGLVDSQPSKTLLERSSSSHRRHHNGSLPRQSSSTMPT